MTEQELRDEFEKDSLFRQFDLLKNECGQYENIETHRAFQGFSKGYSLSKKTIEKQKKEIKLINQQKIKDWDEVNGFSKHNIELKETIKAKDAEIASIFSLLVERDKAIAEARELITYFKGITTSIKMDYEAKAWLENNK